MNKQKHTPTPWKIDGQWVINTHDDPIAVCKIMDNAGQPGGANADLIAAACNSYDKHCGEHAIECAEEDLLGELLKALVGLVSEVDGPDGSPLTTGEKIALLKCRVAIAKAEGQTP